MRYLIAVLSILLLFNGLCYGAGGGYIEDKGGEAATVTSNRLDVNAVQATATNLNATVDLNPGSSIVTHVRDVASAGTRVQLSADSTAILSVTISRKPENLQKIYVGGSGVASDNGFILSKDSVHSITIDTDDAQDIYLDAETSGEGVTWIGLVK